MLPVLRLLVASSCEVQPHVDGEAAPSRLGDLKGRALTCPQRVLVCVEDFELDFGEPGGEGGVAGGLAHVDGPALGVVFGDAFGAIGVARRGQVPCFGADDCAQLGGRGGEGGRRGGRTDVAAYALVLRGVRRGRQALLWGLRTLTRLLFVGGAMAGSANGLRDQ